MTPSDLKHFRQDLGLSQREMAEALRLRKGADGIREMENGKREISGPVHVAVEYMLIYGLLQGLDSGASKSDDQ